MVKLRQFETTLTVIWAENIHLIIILKKHPKKITAQKLTKTVVKTMNKQLSRP